MCNRKKERIMNRYTNEVRALFGEEVLSTIEAKLDASWKLLGFDQKDVFARDDKIAIKVKRKDGSLSMKHSVVKRKKVDGKR